MKYAFTPEQLADPQIGPAAGAVRRCVHCGICTATCPTYVLLGDERDSPRGRIVLMKDMLEKGGAPTKEQVYHIDRCLSCLNCKTACPSSVNYQRLVDQALIDLDRTPTKSRLGANAIIGVSMAVARRSRQNNDASRSTSSRSTAVRAS